MRGFKPKRASGANNYADGGVVSGIKRALGFDPERAARVAEYKAQQKAEAAAAAAPAAAPKLAGGALQNAANALRNRRKQIDEAAGYANGGMVRGPGTGTSDDIETEIPAGSYIMPADSTAQLGEEALSSMGRGFKPGRKKVPVNLSNGEYQLPPEQVHAVGVEALNQVKNATHTPSATEAARGFGPVQEGEPRLFFEGGGSPSEEERRARLSQGLTPYAPNYGPAGLNPQARINAQAAAPTPAAKDPLDGGAVFGMFPQLAGGKRTTYAMDNKLRTGVQATGPSTFAQATPSEKTIIGGGDGRRMNAEQDPRSLTAVVPSGPAAPAPQTSAAPAAQTSLAGDAYMPGADANARPMFDTPAAPASNQVMPGVYQHGRGQYSDNPAGMGFAPGAGNPSANNIAAADALASRSAADVAGLVAAQDARGFQPQQAPQVRHSGNDWQARNDLRNLEVSASSITNQPRWSGQGGRQAAGSVPPAVAAYQAALQTDAELRRAVPSMDQMAMRENAATQRTGMQEQGSNARNTLDNTVRMADVGVRGFDAQARRANDARRASVDERRMTLDENTGNISIRAAQRLESLQTRYAEAKTDADRAKIAREIRDLSGKSDETADWAVQVTPQTKNPDGSTSEGSVIRYNKRTGEVQTVNGANRLTKDSPQVQQIVNDTSLTRDERKARLQALGFS